MTPLENKLVQKSREIFDVSEKWEALFDVWALTDEIIVKWLEVGTDKLRDHFKAHPSKGWHSESWGNKIDTRWFLEDFGSDSIAIGFGWKYELHLHFKDTKRFDRERLANKLKCGKYAALMDRFGISREFNNSANGYVSLVWERCSFTFTNASGVNVPHKEMLPYKLAWYAAHKTEEFVKQTSSKIEEFTCDRQMTQLITELNREAR